MANFFDQFDEPTGGTEKNFFDQFDVPKTPTEEPAHQIGIPLPGGRSFTPSLIGMAKGLLNAGQSFYELPGDVLAGRVDPMSEEGLNRAREGAMLTALPSPAKSLVSAPAKVTATELKTAATPVYNELRETGNVVTSIPGKEMVQEITDFLHPQALRPNSAERTFSELKVLNKAEDLNDVAIVRDKLRDVANGIADNKLVRVTGNDSRAARQAMGQLDTKMEALSPGWTSKMGEADANWAAAKRIETVQKEANKGQKGRLGSFDSNEMRAKGYTADELAAIKKAHQGGMPGAALSAIGAALNPFHGGVSAAVPAALGVVSHGASLPFIPLGMAADAAAKMLRSRALNNAINKLASRSPLARSRGILGP